MATDPATEPSLAPAVVLGVGLGSFVDGIVLHQVLGWHNMLSNLHPPTALESMRLNVLWDGLFHAAAWVATAIGVALLWRAGAHGRVPRPRRFVGGMLIGFALFNLVEGIVDHHVLGLHNVREVANPMPWNIGFLVLSALVLALGLVLARRRTRTEPAAR
jgi:uncharacterized membrane protein